MESNLTATSTRRRLLGVAAGATGAALATTVLHPAQAAAASPGAGPSTRSAGGGVRGTTAGLFALELGTVQQGFLRGADGGDTFADVILVGGQKHISSPVRYDDFSINFGFGMGPELERWVVDSVGQNGSPKEGTLLATDLSRTVTRARAFHQALITEVTIPACDASSKDSGGLGLTFAAQTATDMVRTGTVTAPAPSSQKTWLRSNFRLAIDGLDCTKVSKIDAITMTATPNVDGSPTFDFPNLVITFAAASLSSWKTWFDAFIVSGTGEKFGTLTLLSPNFSTELAVLRFNNVGIFRLDPEPETASGDSIVKARAELYVGRMSFTKLGSTT